MAENCLSGWYTEAYEIIIVVSRVCVHYVRVCVCGKTEEMFEGIMCPVTEMGCKYGQSSQ